MATYMENMGLTKKRVIELLQETLQYEEENPELDVSQVLLDTAEGKTVGEILFLGTVLRDFMKYATGK